MFKEIQGAFFFCWRQAKVQGYMDEDKVGWYLAEINF